MKNLVSRNSERGSHGNIQSKQQKHPQNDLEQEHHEHDQAYLLGQNDLPNSPDQILHLQNVIGNQAVQRLIDPDMPKSQSGEAFLASFGVSSTAQRAAQRQKAEILEEGEDSAFNEGEHTPEIMQNSNLAIQKSPLQRKEMPDGTANAKPDNITPFPAQNVSPAQKGDIQRGALAGKIGKHIGYGVLNMLAEQVIGPFADLKHVIRLGYYSRLKKGKTGTELTKIEDKEKKVKDNVSEEWTGDYQGETWMTVIHALSTTSEKLAVLAGAIAFLATIASAFAPPAAVVATVAGIVGVSLTGLALIGRSILSIASLIKYNKAVDGSDEQKKWKAMGISNLFKSISNVLGIVTFGIGAGVGGVDFKSATKAGADIGIDMGIGTAGALVGIGVNEIETPLQEKRLQRAPEDEETEDETEAKETLMELDKVLEGVDGEMTDEKSAANQEKSDLQQDKSNLDKVDGKLGDITGKTDEIKEQSQEAETELNNADSQAETPEEAGMEGISKNEVKELEEDVGRAEESIDSGKAVGTKPDISKKKGFFKRIKAAAKKAGKSFKRGFKKLFGKLKSVFNRVKALLQKAKMKMTAMVLSVLGISESVAAAHEDVKDQKDNKIPAEMESIDNQTGTMDEIKEKIGELD